MPVGSVAAVDGVVGAQLAAHGDRHALAANAEMDQPVDEERALELRHAFLEAADPPHVAQQRGRDGCPIGRVDAVHECTDYAATGADPRTWCTAPAILASSGST